MSAADWYRPTKRLVIDGQLWTTNGHVIYRACASGLPELSEAHARYVEAMICEAKRAVGPLPEPVNGYLDLSTGHRFSAHLLERAERIFGAVEWLAPEDTLEPIVGYHDGRAAAVVMPCRVTGSAENEISGLPRCPECEGTGKGRPCPVCKGSGVCTCHCLDEHDCPECDGSAYVGTCADCDGSRYWTPPAPPAADAAKDGAP